MKIVPSCEKCNSPIENQEYIVDAESYICGKCSSEAPPSRIIDREVPDNYEIIEQYAECQHGKAYRVRDKSIDTLLVVRFVSAGVARMTGGLPIETVANILTHLNNPHLLTIYDWRTDLPANCLVMDSPPQRSVEKVIQEEGFFDLSRAIDIFIQVCEGLEDLHKQKLVHGFIRPRTIRLVETGSKIDSVKLFSFSIANVFSNNLEQPLKIGRNYTCNDAFYMSPEEFRGALPTVAADVYSLGCVIFHAITGKPLYRAKTVKEVEAQHLDDQPARFRERYEIPNNVQSLVLHMLEKDPAKRYKTVRAVKEDLERVRDKKEPLLEDNWRRVLSWFGG